MADKKKVYTIEINGIQESVDLVKSLNEELKTLDTAISKVKDKTIRIKGQVEVEKPSEEKTVVSGKNATSASEATAEERSEAEKLLAVKKQITEEEKQQAKLAAMSTDEYKESYVNMARTKDEIKQAKAELDAMASGAAKITDEGVEYSNTMKGMKAELKALKAERDKLDLANPEEVERFKEIQQRALELQTLLKAIEEESGVFSRNVGNYPQLLKNATAEWENVQQVITTLSDKLAKMTPGSSGYDKLKTELEQAERYAQKLDERLGDIRSNISQVNATGINIKVGDAERNFSSLKEAVRTLTKELQAMAVAGKTDTAEFKATITTLGQLKTAISNTSQEVQSYVGNAKALSDTIEIMQGVAGIMSIGQGLMTLFGGTNKELDETLKKFAGLTMVMQGLENAQKSLNNDTSIWGKALKTTWTWLDKILTKAPGLDVLTAGFTKLNNVIEKTYKQTKALREYSKGGVDEAFEKARNMVIDFKTDDASLQKVIDKVNVSFAALKDFKISFNMDEKEKAKLIEVIEGEKALLKNAINGTQLKIDTSESQAEIKQLTIDVNLFQERLKALNSTEIYLKTDNPKELFDDIDQSIEQLTNKMKEMEAAGKDTSGIKQIINALTEYRNQAEYATYAATGFSTTLLKWGVAGKVAGTALYYVSGAIKTLGVALKTLGKATIIIGLLQLAMEAIQPVIEAIGEGVRWLTDAVFKAIGGMAGNTAEMDERLDSLSERFDKTSESVDRYIKQLERLEQMGVINTLHKEKMAFNEMGNELKEATDELERFMNRQEEFTVDDLKYHLNNSNIWGDAADIKTIDEFKEHYEALIRAHQDGTDVMEAGWKRGTSWLLTYWDANEQLKDDTKAILGDMGYEIDKVFQEYEKDLKEAGSSTNLQLQAHEKAVENFAKITNSRLYNSALANMHELFKDEDWAKALDKMYTIFSDRVKMMEDRAEDLKVAIAQANKELADQAELSNINAIADANERQKALDAYNKKKRQEEIRNSIADEEHKQKALEALDKEYAQKEKDRIKSHMQTIKSAGDDEYNILKQIRDNLMELEREGLDKQIMKLENAMQDELHAAEKATKHRAELIESIEKKYQKLIEDARTEWYKRLKKQQEDFNKEMIRMAQDAAKELSDIMNTAMLNSIERELSDIENFNTEWTGSLSYNTDIDSSKMSFDENTENLKRQQEYYDTLIKQQRNYIEEKARLQVQESNENERMLKEQAEAEYNQRIDSNKEWIEAQKQQQEQAYKDGLVTDEEYQQNLQTISDTYQTANADAFDAYQMKLTEAERNGVQEREDIITKGRQEMQRANDEANQKALQAIQEYYNEIGEIADREQRENTNRHTGLFDFGKERTRLKKMEEGYTKMMDDLDEAYENLKRQLNDGEIDFDQFRNGKKEIESLKKQAQDAAQDTSESLKDLFQDWAGSVNDIAQRIGQEMQNLYSTFNEIQNLKLDAEEQALDEEEKILDRESEMIEKAYSRQSDIVQRYKDAIDGTEDELKDARGERRLALLDSLAEQREGYLKETETLKEQEQEKEKIARKEEELKKKQDALEKRRKQQQKQASIVNATINTALGVTQALASWPPPASYALAAAVGAMGAAQVSLIAAQKYRKGGLLDGKDHEHGGIKVPVKGGVAEVEGNEFITNKTTTMNNLSLMEFVNSRKRRLNLDDFVEFYSGKAKGQKSGSSLRYAQGGELPELTDYSDIIQQQPLEVNVVVDSKVSVVDIQNALDRLTQTKVLAGLG